VRRPQAPQGDRPLEPSDVVQELERILGSGDFDASPRSRAFVRFIVEEALAGRQDALTQGAIATRVFGRREDFDPTVDPIVRIQAGRLRRSLERYYLVEGARDPVRIDLPRGTYVPLFRWVPAGQDRAGESHAPRPPAPADGWPSVVVSLFESAVPDPNLDEAAVRLQEDLSVEMGRYGDVRVVLRRDRDRLGSSPGGDETFALSGRLSLDEGGPRVRARLVDYRTASQIWAEDYHGEAATASAFYEETARVIAAHVASEYGVVAKLLWAERRSHPREDATPYGAILCSYRFFFNRDPKDFAPAVEALRRVVRAQPECSLAWVQLARLYVANYAFEVAPVETGIDEAVALGQNGVHLDPSSQRARVALAGAFLLKGEIDVGRAEAEKALSLNPESFVYLEWIGWLLTLLGDWERGPRLVRRSMARNPNHIPAAYHALWADHLRRGEFEEAHRAALQYRDATFFWRALMRACSLGHLGRIPEARLEAAELLAMKPDFATRGRTLIGRLVKFPDLMERVVIGLGKAGLELA